MTPILQNMAADVTPRSSSVRLNGYYLSDIKIYIFF